MREVLEQLAVKGFCPVRNINNPIAQVINESNVGGVVSKSQYKNEILLSKQSMRLAICIWKTSN